MCFGDDGGGGGSERTERRHFSSLLFLAALSACFDCEHRVVRSRAEQQWEIDSFLPISEKQ